MKRFLKTKRIIDGLSQKELQEVDVTKKENQLGDKLETGAKTERLLKNLSPFEQKKDWEIMLKFYKKSVVYLQRKLPLDNTVLAKAACLHPDNRKNKFIICQIEYLVKVFPQVIVEKKVSQVKDEWRLYQAEDDHKVLKKPNQRVDNHWREVFKIKTTSGETKYNQFQKVVKSVLSLQNANAAVESSLSDNGNTLMKEWIGLLPENLIGLRRMKEYARHKGGFHCIVFTQNMLEGMKKAKRKNDG